MLALLLPWMLAAQESPRGLTTLEPQQLLAALPKAPPGWTLKISTASNDADDWLEAEAERVYEFPAEEEGGEPTLVRVGVLDTAGQGTALENFADFKVGPLGDGVTASIIDGMPAIRAAGDGFAHFEMLVDKRFVVEILWRGSKEIELKDWLSGVRVSVLRAGARKSEEIDFPEQIRITEIDELNPEKSATYLMAMSTGAQIERQLLDDERFQELIDEALAEGQDVDELDLSEFE